MRAIHVIPGTSGRLVVTEGIVAFLAEADVEVLAALGEGVEEPFKRLAKVIVARDFEVAPLLAVDRSANRLFLFGELSVSVDGVDISGGDAASWVEHALSHSHKLICNPDQTPVASETWLETGCIPAAGFVAQPTAWDNGASAESVKSADKADQERSDPYSHTSDSGHASGSSDPITEQTGTDKDKPIAVDVASILDERDVDLERLGSHQEKAGPSTPTPSPAGSDVPPLRKRPPRHVDLRPQDDASAADDNLANSRGPTPRHIFREPPSSRPAAFTRNVSVAESDPPENSGPAADSALLTLSDGQTFAVTTGLLIGRNPAKNGVPIGYVTAAVLGGSVSRVHLEITVSGRSVVGRDCETPNGSRLRRDGGSSSLPTDPAGIALVVGDIIEFGEELTLEFTGWSGDA